MIITAGYSAAPTRTTTLAHNTTIIPAAVPRRLWHFFQHYGTVENYSLRDAGACAMEPRVSCCRLEPVGVSTYAQFIHRREEAVEFGATFQPRRAIVFAAAEADGETR